MTKETMTVHKGLAELKIIDNRIINVIDESTFVVENKNSNNKIAGIPLKDYEKQMQGSYDKATDLIARRKAILSAVHLSNAVTKVTIDGTEMTVAEAINLKNHGMELEQILVATMKKQLSKAVTKITKNNGDDLEKRADNYVAGIYGNKDIKTDNKEVEKLRNDFLESNKFVLVDPIKVQDKIDVLEERIATFMAEVDAALSVSNALTVITIEY